MLKITNLSVKLGEKNEKGCVAAFLRINESDIIDLNLIKRSIDARKKNDIHYVCAYVVKLKCNENGVASRLNSKNVSVYEIPAYTYLKAEKRRRVAIVGFGPSGIFAALTLLKGGITPIVLERGESVEGRISDVEEFKKSGILKPNSNIQFGEGGAGTFSDGKLNTGISDARISHVLNTFCEHGAPEEIKYAAKPHIGTDNLVKIVRSMRSEIERLGGSVRFNSQVDDLIIKGGKVAAVILAGGEEIPCDAVVLATGHSSRDTFEMLYSKGLNIIPKDFSIGVRIEHLQRDIDRCQYGDVSGLPAADYKLSAHLKSGRGVYTFCMCPGGSVVAAASEEGGVVTNGMSEFNRGSKNANSAMLVSVTKEDFESSHPLAGMYFQRKYEQLAYKVSNSFKAPAVMVGDFLKGRTSRSFGRVQPSYPLGTVMSDFRECLPKFAVDSLREAMPEFERRLKGYSAYEAVMTGIETRSSSPIRILRGEDGQSNILGIYPCGEGSGYAGGIMSSAVDGIKTAELLLMLK